MTVTRSRILGPDEKPLMIVKENDALNYFSAARSTHDRGFIGSGLLDADTDIETGRSEIMRKMRFLYKNSALCRGTVEWLTTLIVGTGICPIPDTEDEDFNERAEDAWLNWVDHADYYGQFSWYELQAIICRTQLVDGDVGSVLTRDRKNRARIQNLEGHRIGGAWARPENTVRTDRNGKITHYLVTVKDEFIPVPVSKFVLHFFPSRINQKRGISIYHAALNTIQDIEETIGFEKLSVKKHSSQEGILNIKDDEGNISENIVTSDDMDSFTSKLDGEKKYQHYKETYGTETKIMIGNDQYIPLTSDRPSPAFQGFIEHLKHSISLSLGIPASVLFQNKVGGVDSRRDIQFSSRGIQMLQAPVIRQSTKIYNYVIQSEINNGNIKSFPQNWKSKVLMLPPEDITVDNGRDSKSERENIRMGLTTLREYFGRRKKSWKKELRQSVKEQKFIQELAESENINSDQILYKAIKNEG